jgi:MFS family permease
MGMTQGLLSAAVADAAPERLRGTAFGLLDVVVGLTTFTASAGAGAIWTLMGAAGSFGAGAVLATVAMAALTTRFITKQEHPR